MPAKPDSEVLYGFGERLRTLRKRAGLSQAELSNEIKVTKQAISWWEQGFTPNCSALALYRAAIVLDTTMEYLIAGNTFLSTVCSNTMYQALDETRNEEIEHEMMDQATARDEMPETMEELADSDPRPGPTMCNVCGGFYRPTLTECPWCDCISDMAEEEIESMSEAEIDQATLDAGRDPNAMVEKALKSVEVPHD